MFSFEGDYKRRPIQSLSGASKQEGTASLLLKNQLERQKRENYRKSVTSAIKIQSFYRGSVCRHVQKKRQRYEFDVLMASLQLSPEKFDVNESIWIIRKLLFFYNKTEDTIRIISLCHIVLRNKDAFAQLVIQTTNGILHLLQRLLHLCCNYLEIIAASNSPLAVPMRMLELFTSPSTYQKYTTSASSIVTIIDTIMVYLIRKGYFNSMRVLLENRIPSSLEKNVHPPTPVAATILEYINKPLNAVKSTNFDRSTKDLIMCHFCKDVMCKKYTAQISLFLVPALANRQFPFVDLVRALVSISHNASQPSVRLKVPPSPWLLSAILQLSQAHLNDFSNDDKCLYLLILQQLIPHIPYKLSTFISTYAGDIPSEDEQEMDLQEPMDDLEECREDFLNYIQGPEQVQCMTSVVQCDEPNLMTVFAICTICHTLMAKHKFIVHKNRLLSTLAFNIPFIRSLWQLCISITTTSVTGAQTPLLQLLSRGLSMSAEDRDRIAPVLSLFCSSFCTFIMSLHDAEFFNEGDAYQYSEKVMPFSVSEVIPISLALRDACLGIIELAHPDTKPVLQDHYRKVFKSIGIQSETITAEELRIKTATWAYLFRVTAQLVKQVFARDTRHPFCPKKHWLSNRVSIYADKPSQIYRAKYSVFVSRPFGALSLLNRNPEEEEGPPLSNTEVRNLTILTELPFVVPFQERVKIFQKLLQNDKDEEQGDRHNFMAGNAISVMIRRNYIYEDAFEKLSSENEPNLKLKMRIQLVNVAGLDEAGIDGGGIFREFLSELLKTAFDPNRGFFKTTTDQLLYPNPHADVLLENFTQHYFFMGRILGKALYENMLVELPFAGFFLSKILSRHSGDIDIHHLASLDPEVYKNLLYLKNYEGNVSDLDLDFTIVSSVLGETKIDELVSDGSEIRVTNLNHIEYIHRVADFRLNRQIRAQCNAFRQGLANVVNLEWLRMFDQHELQILISGAQIPVDLEDLKQHTNYSGGYSSSHDVIRSFWKVVETFNDKERAQLLKFVTSCSRPPLLGFKDLYPAFCIHSGGAAEDRLPTASTCMNLLKLPEFKDEETMRNKLLYAIESGAGFELS